MYNRKPVGYDHKVPQMVSESLFSLVQGSNRLSSCVSIFNSFFIIEMFLIVCKPPFAFEWGWIITHTHTRGRKQYHAPGYTSAQGNENNFATVTNFRNQWYIKILSNNLFICRSRSAFGQAVQCDGSYQVQCIHTCHSRVRLPVWPSASVCARPVSWYCSCGSHSARLSFCYEGDDSSLLWAIWRLFLPNEIEQSVGGAGHRLLALIGVLLLSSSTRVDDVHHDDAHHHGDEGGPEVVGDGHDAQAAGALGVQGGETRH